MKRTLKQELEYNNQPQYKGSNYPSIEGITYGGSCPLPTHNATKWKMLNGGYGAEQQKIAQERVHKNLRWLNNSYESEAEEHEEFIEEKPELSELEKALARIEELEKANVEKDKIIKKLKNQSPVNSEDIISKKEVEKIIEENNKRFKEVEEENLFKDKIMANQKKEIQHSEQIKKMQSDHIAELLEDKADLREQVKFLKTDVIELKEGFKTKEIDIKDLKELNFSKDKKIDELQIKMQEMLLHHSENNSSGFELIDEHVNISGAHNVENEEII